VLKALGLVRTGHIGIPKTFSSDFTARVEEPDSPRQQRRLADHDVRHAPHALRPRQEREAVGVNPRGGTARVPPYRLDNTRRYAAS
jgi:hypothetical protein